MSSPLNVFNAFSQYYDLIYHDKDYVREADYIRVLLTRYGVPEGSLLEFGSGTGRHGCLLADRGYLVHGIEQSAEMLALARAVPGFSSQQGDICDVQLNRTFEAVLALFHVVSYQTTNNAVQAVFSRAAQHLEVGGLFIFDVWYSPAVCAQKPSVRVKRVANDAIDVVRIAEPALYPNENLVEVDYTIFVRDLVSGALEVLSEVHPMRHFSLPELNYYAQMSGFLVLGAEEFLTGNPASEETWGVCLILKKVG